MKESPEPSGGEKNMLHPRNKHRGRYDFSELIAESPKLSEYVFLNKFQNLSVDFENPKAVKALNQALLKVSYNIQHWDIPEGYLCPPIPGRADYIHYMADLLSESIHGKVSGKTIKVLDIGVGANCIYPLIGYSEYGWRFVGSEIDKIAIQSAKNILEANSLTNFITIRKQDSPGKIFNGFINRNETFDLTMSNPPFHRNSNDAALGTARKWKNLGKKVTEDSALNFAGKNSELWCEGGEAEFIRRMILESAEFCNSCCWFTTLVSKKETLRPSYHALERVHAQEIKTINMAQGQKNSRILAWTFFTKDQQERWLTAK